MGTNIPEQRRAMLVVYRDEESIGTRTILLPEDGEVTVGRSRASTIHVDSEKVSRNHAIIRHDEDGVTVEDLGSRNGTRLNGAKINGTYTVASGDELSIGPANIILHIPTPARRRVAIGSTTYLDERLAAEAERGLRYQRKFGLIMLRLQTETDVADAILEHVAQRLRRMDVVAEYGPDEFAFLLPEVDLNSAQLAAQRLLHEIRDVEQRLAPASAVAVHIGVASFPEHGTRPGELLNRARDALLLARRETGGDGVAMPPKEAQPSADNVVVGDPKMKRVFELARKVGNSPMTVLIFGETGVGKEIIAEEVHRSSERRQHRFLRLNCASIPETLLERELFGHERGAYTGAEKRSKGYFEAADRGTIFLDEIGEVSLAMQGKLLRVLEERKFMRLGGTEEIAVDVRVVCATNRDLEADVARGRFREDLFFRISAFTIVVPPLRDRTVEVAMLAERFIAQTARDLQVAAPQPTPEFMQALSRYQWPGNIRELRNAIERAMVVQSDGVLDVAHLPDRLRDEAAIDASSAKNEVTVSVGKGVDVREQLAVVERRAIAAALEGCKGNQTRAAKKLGLSRRALIYKMEKYGLKRAPGK